MDFTAFKGWLSDVLNEVQNFIFLVLPDSPIQTLEMPEEVEAILGYINWVLPFQAIGTTLMLWCSAIVIYYAYQTILRWTKSIQ